MADLALLLLIFGLRIGPQMVFAWATARYGEHRSDLKYTGTELARRLLDENGLADVRVEELREEASDFGDCYDPSKRVVRLSPTVSHGRSITAYAVAAHEVGHALQHAAHDGDWELQQGLASIMRILMWGAVACVLFVVLLSEPLGGHERWHWLNTLALSVFIGGGVLLRIVTLPVEWNASFAHAVPMLRSLRALNEADLRKADTLLLVAATTYIAFAVLGVLAAVVLLRD